MNNSAKNYNEFALCTNVFLFGNHNDRDCNSIYYLIRNMTQKNLDLKSLLLDLFSPFFISPQELEQLMQLYNESDRSGVLYQIGVSTQLISKLAYPAGIAGVLNYYKGESNLGEIIQRLREEICEENMDALAYISSLQARLLIPPHQAYRVQEIHLSTMSEENQKLFDKKLLFCVENIMKYLINNLNG